MENGDDAIVGQGCSQWVARDHLPDEATPSATRRTRDKHQRGIFGQTPFSEDEQRLMHAALNVPPDRAQGDVVAEANRIFGFNGWARSIKKVAVIQEEQGESGWNVVASATVAIVLKNGARHEDTGTGIIKDTLLKGRAVVQAQQIAVDDATKRAMRFFGIRFDIAS